MKYEISLLLNVILSLILVLIFIYWSIKKIKITTIIKKIIISKDYNIVVYVFKKFAYVLLVLILSYYLYDAWINIKDINLYKELSPKIILLIFLLIMVVLPFIKKVEVLGMKLDLKDKELEIGKAANDAIYALEQQENTAKVTIEDLNKIEKEMEEWYMKNNYTYLKEIIEKGIKLNNTNLTQYSLTSWTTYTTRMLELITDKNPMITLNFLRLQTEADIISKSPNDKLNTYLKYLIDIAKYV